MDRSVVPHKASPKIQGSLDQMLPWMALVDFCWADYYQRVAGVGHHRTNKLMKHGQVLTASVRKQIARKRRHGGDVISKMVVGLMAAGYGGILLLLIHVVQQTNSESGPLMALFPQTAYGLHIATGLFGVAITGLVLNQLRNRRRSDRFNGALLVQVLISSLIMAPFLYQ